MLSCRLWLLPFLPSAWDFNTGENVMSRKAYKRLAVGAAAVLIIIGLQAIETRRDDGYMPPVQPSRVLVEQDYAPVNPWTITGPTYVSYPLIEDSGITDIQEGYLNGPQGYAYFAVAPGRKTGSLPATLGGKSGWTLDAWASNFQGPVKIGARSERVQWEWTAKQSLQTSGSRSYPFVYGVLSQTDANMLKERTYGLFEHDEDFWLNPWSKDDYLGSFTIDHSACQTQVFDKSDSGWTEELNAGTSGYIVFVRYRLFCFRIEPATSPARSER